MKLLHFLLFFLSFSLGSSLFFKPLFLRLSWNEAKKLEKLVEVAAKQRPRVEDRRSVTPLETKACNVGGSATESLSRLLFILRKIRRREEKTKCEVLNGRRNLVQQERGELSFTR